MTTHTMTTTTENTPDSRPFVLVSLASREPRPALRFRYRGIPPPPNGWRVTAARMAELDAAGLLLFPTRPGGTIRLRRVVDAGEDAQTGRRKAG